MNPMRFFLISGLAFLIIFSLYSDEPSYPSAQKGVQDLSNYSFKQVQKLEIRGEWEFYWQKLLEPEDFFAPAPLQDTLYIWFPAVWKDKEEEGVRFFHHGYATLRIVLLLPGDTPDVLDLFLQPVYSACRLFINGKEEYSAGSVATNRNGETTSFTSSHILFPVTGERLEIILQISNYHFSRIGSWGPFYIGHPESLVSADQLNSIYQFIYFGFVLCVGIISCLLYINLKSEKVLLFFSLFCFVHALHSVLYDGIYLFKLLPGLPVFNIFFSSFLIWSQSLCLGLFFYSLYPKEFNRTIIAGIVLLFILLDCYIWFIPAEISLLTTDAFFIICFSEILYVIISLVRAIVKKRKGSLFFMLSMLGVMVIYGLNLFIGSLFSSYFTLSFLSVMLLLVGYFIYLSRMFTRTYTTFKTDKETADQCRQSFISAFGLSSREIDVLEFILRGKGAKEIAGAYNISARTVETHTYNIYRKMNVHSRLEILSLFHEFQG